MGHEINQVLSKDEGADAISGGVRNMIVRHNAIPWSVVCGS